MQSTPFPTEIRLICRGSSKQFGNREVDAPSQLDCSYCIAVYCSSEAWSAAWLTLTQPVSEELKSSGDGGNIPLSDSPPLDLLDALVNDPR